MELGLETTAILLVAILGITLGRLFSRLQKPYWLIGYLLSFILIAILVVTRYTNYQIFPAPLYGLATGRLRFIILALSITMGLTTMLPHTPRKFEKIIIYIIMAGFLVCFSFAPFLASSIYADDLLSLQTIIDSDGICYQSKSYTCAPAAAVTALRKLGFNAYEGEIAVLAHTNPLTGTLPQCLYTALQNRYGDKGLECQYRHFDSINQLKNQGITLAVIKDAFLSDHCVAILEVSDKAVIIADPDVGKMNISHKQFEKIWRFSGIVLSRAPSQSI